MMEIFTRKRVICKSAALPPHSPLSLYPLLSCLMLFCHSATPPYPTTSESDDEDSDISDEEESEGSSSEDPDEALRIEEKMDKKRGRPKKLGKVTRHACYFDHPFAGRTYFRTCRWPLRSQTRPMTSGKKAKRNFCTRNARTSTD